MFRYYKNHVQDNLRVDYLHNSILQPHLSFLHRFSPTLLPATYAPPHFLHAVRHSPGPLSMYCSTSLSNPNHHHFISSPFSAVNLHSHTSLTKHHHRHPPSQSESSMILMAGLYRQDNSPKTTLGTTINADLPESANTANHL